MRLYAALLVAVAAMSPVAVTFSPPATADCNYSGGSTLCASGDVRGGSGGGSPGPSAPYSPYPCFDFGDPLCLAYDNYDPGIVFDPPNRINRPVVDPGYGIPSGRPGGGIGRN